MVTHISTHGVLCPIYLKLGKDSPPVQLEQPDTTNGIVFKDVRFSLVAVPPGLLTITGNFLNLTHYLELNNHIELLMHLSI